MMGSGYRRIAAIGLLLTGLAVVVWGCAPHRRGAPGPRTGERERVRQQRLHEWRSGPRLLRVGLAAGREVLVVEAPGEVDLATGGRTVPGGSFTIRRTAAGVEAVRSDGTVAASAAGPLRLAPTDPRAHLVFDGRPYDGELLAVPRDDGLTLVNVLELESYLRGVVPWEIGRPGQSGLAALEAQSVAARTYTVAHLGERQAHGFDVWADTRDQVYKGLEGTDRWCDLAIESTAGLVLRHDGAEIEAYYSSTCGGTTSNVHEVWQRPSRPYLRSHSDRGRDGKAYCAGSSQFQWHDTWTRDEIEGVLARSLPAYLDWVAASPSRTRWAGRVFEPSGSGADPREPGRLRNIRVTRRTTSGRVDRLEVVTTSGVYRIRGDRTRWVLAPASGRFSILRSAWFDVDLVRDREGRLVSVRLDGRGFGHGVGLCQVGALRMAELGHTYRAILEHYYPGARLETAWR